MLVLGIETSCDDTSICLLHDHKILSHVSFTQEKILAKWGGVVPEIASRNHLDKLLPLLKEVCQEAMVSPADLDLIGVTTHPGLLGPLLTGLNAAKTLSLIHKLPILPVNHLYAHLEAIHLTEEIEYPYLGLLVSGGHSLYMLVEDQETFLILGSTVDDAAGEAFDKGAKLLGLGYPGGVVIDTLAAKGDPNAYQFPIGLRGSKNCNLSFSGTKTSLRLFHEKNPDAKIEDVCASYQEAIVSALALKLKYAVKQAGDLPIVVGGGVAANSALRKRLSKDFKQVHFVKPCFCTDNGAMIANYAKRTIYNAHKYPESLCIDARGKFVDIGSLIEGQ